ncbi:MAG: dihydroorotase [Epsilonproteobacteria bacterium]|nr:dihydroorotase [Campylobacterota bacterium]
MILHNPIDMHLHIRQGTMLQKVLPWSADYFSSAVIMPNITPPVTSLQRVQEYKQEILACKDNFTPLLDVFLQKFTKEEIEQLKPHIFAMKFYPDGITTNSNSGINGIEEIYPTLELLAQYNIPLSIHGETNASVLEREREFAKVYEKLAQDFPNLTIIMEHISTKELANLATKYDNLLATVTLHHLLLSIDDLCGGALNVHYFCKPTVKLASDKEALGELVKSGHKNVMFGSDSAPHPLKNKFKGAAGIFSAPVILPKLAEFFDGDWDTFQKFISTNAIENFNLEFTPKKVEIVEDEWVVPRMIGEVVPIFAGERLPFSVKVVDEID